MKTPKRIFDYPSDPNADISSLYEREATQRARWKRKNREAQLRRTISRLQEALAKSEYEKNRTHARLYGKYVELATKHAYLYEIMRGAEMNLQGLLFKSTYGHDIEGS